MVVSATIIESSDVFGDGEISTVALVDFNSNVVGGGVGSAASKIQVIVTGTQWQLWQWRSNDSGSGTTSAASYGGAPLLTCFYSFGVVGLGRVPKLQVQYPSLEQTNIANSFKKLTGLCTDGNYDILIVDIELINIV
ncbi:hypothetical protein DM860_015326 [Cuscuta australis]|uniref:Uncharacterized protein n=1 Tax=Cuscuta australis TaxID=267555 RepID=A0A328DQR5_9ASTE|nr:hypothetical protein DM860_015326 [Cuscuta australis]